MRNIILSIFVLFLFTETALGTEERCQVQGEEVRCEFNGDTGLELFDDLKVHQIQRLLISLDESWGSLFLVSNPYLVEWGNFSYCWGLNLEKTHRVFLTCSNHDNFGETIPNYIDEKLLSLR